jgi:chlorite dismutase
MSTETQTEIEKIEAITRSAKAACVIATKEITELSDTLLPLLRAYINDLRQIRMSLGSETTEIIRCSAELHQLTKHSPAIKEFVGLVSILRDVLTPEFMEKLKRLTSEETKK